MQRRKTTATESSSDRDLLIALLQEQLRKMEEQYKKSLDEQQDMRQRYGSVVQQLATLKLIINQLSEENKKLTSIDETSKGQKELLDVSEKWKIKYEELIAKFSELEREHFAHRPQLDVIMDQVKKVEHLLANQNQQISLLVNSQDLDLSYYHTARNSTESNPMKPTGKNSKSDLKTKDFSEQTDTMDLSRPKRDSEVYYKTRDFSEQTEREFDEEERGIDEEVEVDFKKKQTERGTVMEHVGENVDTHNDVQNSLNIMGTFTMLPLTTVKEVLPYSDDEKVDDNQSGDNKISKSDKSEEKVEQELELTDYHLVPSDAPKMEKKHKPNMNHLLSFAANPRIERNAFVYYVTSDDPDDPTDDDEQKQQSSTQDEDENKAKEEPEQPKETQETQETQETPETQETKGSKVNVDGPKEVSYILGWEPPVTPPCPKNDSCLRYNESYLSERKEKGGKKGGSDKKKKNKKGENCAIGSLIIESGCEDSDHSDNRGVSFDKITNSKSPCKDQHCPQLAIFDKSNDRRVSFDKITNKQYPCVPKDERCPDFSESDDSDASGTCQSNAKKTKTKKSSNDKDKQNQQKYKKTIEKQRSEIRDLKKRLVEKHQTLCSALSLDDEQTSRNESLLKEYEKEIDSINRRYEAAMRELEKVSKSNRELQRDVEKLQTSGKQAQSSSGSLNNPNENYLRVNRALDDLEKKLADKDRDLVRMKGIEEELDGYKKIADGLKRQNEELQKSLDSTGWENCMCKRRIKELEGYREELARTKMNDQALAQANRELEEQLAAGTVQEKKLLEHLKVILTQYELEKEKLMEENSKLNDELNEEKEKSEKSQKQIDEISRENETLKNKVPEEPEPKKPEPEEKTDEKYDYLKDKLKMSNAEVQVLKETNSKLRSELAALTKRLDELGKKKSWEAEGEGPCYGNRPAVQTIYDNDKYVENVSEGSTAKTTSCLPSCEPSTTRISCDDRRRTSSRSPVKSEKSSKKSPSKVPVNQNATKKPQKPKASDQCNRCPHGKNVKYA